jgi:hypothetical protein
VADYAGNDCTGRRVLVNFTGSSSIYAQEIQVAGGAVAFGASGGYPRWVFLTPTGKGGSLGISVTGTLPIFQEGNLYCWFRLSPGCLRSHSSFKNDKDSQQAYAYYA